MAIFNCNTYVFSQSLKQSFEIGIIFIVQMMTLRHIEFSNFLSLILPASIGARIWSQAVWARAYLGHLDICGSLESQEINSSWRLVWRKISQTFV